MATKILTHWPLGSYTDHDDAHRNLYLEQVSILGVPFDLTYDTLKSEDLCMFFLDTQYMEQSHQVGPVFYI